MPSANIGQYHIRSLSADSMGALAIPRVRISAVYKHRRCGVPETHPGRHKYPELLNVKGTCHGGWEGNGKVEINLRNSRFLKV